MTHLKDWASIEVCDSDMCRVLTEVLCSFGVFTELRVRGVESLSSGGFRVNLCPAERQPKAAKK